MSHHESIFILQEFPASLSLIQKNLVRLGYTLLTLNESQQVQAQVFRKSDVILVPISSSTLSGDLEAMLAVLQEQTSKPQIWGLYSGRQKIPTTELLALGIKSIFQIPLEEDLFLNKLFSYLPTDFRSDEIEFQDLVRVGISEIEKCNKSPFDIYVYLPSNRKIVQYLNENDVVSERMRDKFKSHNEYNLYIRRTDLKKYNDFYGLLLKTTLGDSGLSSEIQSKQLQQQVSGLMSSFFNEDSLDQDEAQQMLANVDQILTQLEDTHSKLGTSNESSADNSKENSEEKLNAFAAQKWTNASHSQNVAAYCVLFGIAMGVKEIKELRVGGWLHDIGLADLSNEVLQKDFHKMSESEQAQYRLHPGNAKLSLEQKNILLPKRAMDMILFHHERSNGEGYPYGKTDTQIPVSAKICAFADEFDRLTSVREGHLQLSPREALLRLSGGDGHPADPVFDAKVHQPIIDLYLHKQQKPAAKKYGKIVGQGTKLGASTTSLKDLQKELKGKSEPIEGYQFSKDVEKEALAMVEELKKHFTRLAETC